MAPPSLPELAALTAAVAQVAPRAAPERACQGLLGLLGAEVALSVVLDGPEGPVVRAWAAQEAASAVDALGRDSRDPLGTLRAAVDAGWSPGSPEPWRRALELRSGRRWTVLGAPVGERSTLAVAGSTDLAWDEEATAALATVATVLHLRGSDDRRTRDALRQAQVAAAMTGLLELGVRATSAREAAEALAKVAAAALDLPISCGYLVENDRISEVVVHGVEAPLAARLRQVLLGARADDSPVWRRTVGGERPVPDLVEDTSVPGTVREAGVARLLGLGCLAAIPLLSADGPLGLVLCGDRRPRRGWRRSDREVLERLALEGAVVVDNARLRARERFDAFHDPLTGLANRRALADALAEVLARGEGAALAVVDLDGFKEVNDTLGHLAGDQLLRCLASRVRSCLPDGALAARLGGDELAILLPGSSRERAAELAACVRRCLAEPFRLGDRGLVLSASLGVAEAQPGDSPGALLHRADVAMYRRKRQRRQGASPRWLPAPGDGSLSVGCS
jgi:diguanylate cyclase (GGDEF)-like protein